LRNGAEKKWFDNLWPAVKLVMSRWLDVLDEKKEGNTLWIWVYEKLDLNSLATRREEGVKKFNLIHFLSIVSPETIFDFTENLNSQGGFIFNLYGIRSIHFEFPL